MEACAQHAPSYRLSRAFSSLQTHIAGNHDISRYRLNSDLERGVSLFRRMHILL